MVPANHPLVKLWQTIDWTGINRLCASVYKNSHVGQRAWAPAQLFGLLLLLFIQPIASECGLLRLVAIVPLYRWFCGFGLFSSLPDHSTLYTFRRKMGKERFEAILTWLVLRCQEAGLVANELVHFDMMGVAASAQAWRPYERVVLLTWALSRYWELAEKGEAPAAPLPEAMRQLAAEIALEVIGNKGLLAEPSSAGRVVRSLERWTGRQQAGNGMPLWEMALEEAVRCLVREEGMEASCCPHEASACHQWLTKVARRLKGLLPHARGDLDARVLRMSAVELKCGYWLGFLVDGLYGVITALRVVPLNVTQETQMLPALAWHRQRLGAYPQAVAADSAQDYDSVHRWLDQHQIQGHIASRNHKTRGGGLSSECFTWDEKGRLRCPQGHPMEPGKRRKDGLQPFRAKAEDCALCPRRADCLTKGQQPNGPRLIHLKPAAHRRWLENRAHTRTEAYKEAQRKRFASERWFGLAGRLYGADKMPYRSTAMNQIAGLMTGIAMNLTLLAQHGEPA
jgi:transposase